MSKTKKVNNYHIVKNFPADVSMPGRVFGNILFFISATKVTNRKNRLGKHDYIKAKDIISTGDIVLVGGFRTLSGLFMGKSFTHSLLYIGSGQCIHSSADGVDYASFKDLFEEYDTLLLLRPNLGAEAIKLSDKIVSVARQKIGKPYNFYLENLKHRYTCTQLVIDSFTEGGFDLNVKKSKKRGSHIFSRIKRAVRADDLIKSNSKIVFTSRSVRGKLRLK